MNPSKRRSQPGLLISLGNEAFQRLQLQSVLDALNRNAEKRPRALGEDIEWRLVNMKTRQLEMQRLISLWESAGRNIELLFRKNPEVRRNCSEGKTLLVPNRDGEAQLAWLPQLNTGNVPQGHAEAWRLFIWFLLNPKAKLLGGPCARCKKYFQKRDPRQKTYCSGKCGKAQTAGARTRVRREEEHRRKIEKIQSGIRAWERRGRRGDWKRWVAAQTGIHRRSITQALTRGKVMPPGSSFLTN